MTKSIEGHIYRVAHDNFDSAHAQKIFDDDDRVSKNYFAWSLLLRLNSFSEWRFFLGGFSAHADMPFLYSLELTSLHFLLIFFFWPTGSEVVERPHSAPDLALAHLPALAGAPEFPHA